MYQLEQKKVDRLMFAINALAEKLDAHPLKALLLQDATVKEIRTAYLELQTEILNEKSNDHH